MTHTDVIKKAMIDTGTRQVDIVERTGIKRQSVLSERINQKNISVKALTEVLEAMGYELVAQPIPQDGRRYEGQYVMNFADYQ